MKKMVSDVTIVVCFGHMLFAMANNAQGVLLSSFIDAFGLSGGAQGMPNAAANAGIIAAMLLAVPFAARFGKAVLFAGGLFLMAVMLVAASFAPAAWVLVAAYLVMGFAFGNIDTTASALIADLHQGKRASMMMGVLHAVYGIGGILAPLWMTILLTHGSSWQRVLCILGGLALYAAVMATVTFVRAKPVLRDARKTKETFTLAGLMQFARRKGNLWMVLSVGLYCAHQCSVYLWISRIIGVGYGNEALGAAALSLFWVGTVISRLLVPMTGINAVRYMRWGMLLTAAVLGIGTAIGGAVACCIAAAAAGLIGGACIPMSLADISARNPDQSMLSITAVLLTTAISAMICAPLIGFIVEKTALIAGLVVSAVFAAGCGLTAFAIRAEKNYL